MDEIHLLELNRFMWLLRSLGHTTLELLGSLCVFYVERSHVIHTPFSIICTILSVFIRYLFDPIKLLCCMAGKTRGYSLHPKYGRSSF